MDDIEAHIEKSNLPVLDDELEAASHVVMGSIHILKLRKIRDVLKCAQVAVVDEQSLDVGVARSDYLPHFKTDLLE